MARLPQGWFLNAPVLWLAALALISAIRGPLRNAPVLVKKLLSLAVASLIATGLLVLLVWEPVIRASKASVALSALWILLLGLGPIGLIVSFFKILFSKPHQKGTLATVSSSVQRPGPRPLEVVRNVPAERFSNEIGRAHV